MSEEEKGEPEFQISHASFRDRHSVIGINDLAGRRCFNGADIEVQADVGCGDGRQDTGSCVRRGSESGIGIDAEDDRDHAQEEQQAFQMRSMIVQTPSRAKSSVDCKPGEPRKRRGLAAPASFARKAAK